MREDDERPDRACGSRACARTVATMVTAAVLLVTASANAQRGAPKDVVLAPGLHLLASPQGNLVVRIGAHESFVAGPQRPELVAAARALLAAQHAPPARFVVALSADGAARWGDGGWERGGALAVAHELERARMARGGATALPSIGFSEVVQLALSGDEAHVVHQPAGYSDADAIVHLERSGVLLLGGDYTSDGYPHLDLASGGSLDGIIHVADEFVKGFAGTPIRLVPMRGPVTGIDELRAYRDMLVGVRDRVARLVAAGATEHAVIAAKPTAAFDARWGHGPVSGDAFAAAAYRSLASPRR